MIRVRVLLAAALGLVVLAVPAQGASEEQTRSLTIRLVSVTTQFKILVDKAPKNELGKGDVIFLVPERPLRTYRGIVKGVRVRGLREKRDRL